ncbi:hypothetical protein BC832DRAFT_130014 [Gaertneriomyces semiglobifer]|nr:hypothetical protein BC832DRAFT_130014 [Gaertneriomyces semiglobifer]
MLLTTVLVRSTYVAFTSVLVESENQARKREEISEAITQDIAEFAKEFNKERLNGAKRNLEFGQKMHQELWEAYEALDKAKQAYDKLAKEAETARRKYDEVARKPGSGLNVIRNLVTGTDSEERVEKQRSKWKSLTRKLNDARNEYILALEGVNTIQGLYYKDELPNLMRNLDGTFYTTYPTLLSKYASLEDDFSTSLNTSVSSIRTSLQTVEREKEITAFLQQNGSAFGDPGAFHFEATSGDDIARLTVDDVTRVTLGQRLGRLIQQEEEIAATLAQREKELAGCTQMAGVYAQTPSFGNAASPLEQRQEIENSIHLLNATKTKIDSQIQLLKTVGVEPIMPSIPTVVLPNGGSNPQPDAVALYDYDAKSPQEVNLRTDDELLILTPESDGWVKVQNLVSQAQGLVPSTYIRQTQNQTYPSPQSTPVSPTSVAPTQMLRLPSLSSTNTIATAASSAVATTTSHTPASTAAVKQQVKALYDFAASDTFEVSFSAGDMIDVLDAGGDFSDEAWWEGRVVRTGERGQFPVVFTQGWQALASTTSSSNSGGSGVGGGQTLQAVNGTQLGGSTGTSIASLPISIHLNRTSTIDTAATSRRSSSYIAAGASIQKQPKVKAIYAYESTCDGELTIQPSDIITIISKDTGSDAWWEGESIRGRGQFPADYVEPFDDIGSAISLDKRMSTISTNGGSLGGTAAMSTSTIAAAPAPAMAKVYPRAKALYDYVASESDELSFKSGDILNLLLIEVCSFLFISLPFFWFPARYQRYTWRCKSLGCVVY